jgi:hypothetical protein
LRALQEVQDELSSLRWLAEEYNQTTTAATAARKAADLSLTLYRDGASSFLEVVTAQSTALEDERLAIALHTHQLVADIGLMLALGGGWTCRPNRLRNRALRPISRNSSRSLSTRNGQCDLLGIAPANPSLCSRGSRRLLRP